MGALFVYGGLALFAVLVITFILKTDNSRKDPSGRWIAEVYLVGDYGYKQVIFRNRYAFAKDSEYAAMRQANIIRRKMIKKNGEGTYPGSVNAGGRSLVVMYQHYSIPPVNEASYLKPIDTYKVLV